MLGERDTKQVAEELEEKSSGGGLMWRWRRAGRFWRWAKV